MMEEFQSEIEAAGLIPGEIIADGQLHRCPVEGKPGALDGAYIFHTDDPPSGYYKNHHTGQESNWTSGRQEPLNEDERRKLRERIEADKADRQKEQEQKWAAAAARAKSMLEQAAACESHPYLNKKGVQPCDGLKVRDDNMLLVPVRGPDGKVQSLQTINPDGDKKFFPDGKMAGGFFAVGQDKNGPLAICEGLATGLSIHEATGLTTLVAFDAGKLKAVAHTARKSYPDRQILICGDDDAKTPGNPGRTKATAAAQAVGANLALPVFKGDQVGTDFNDLHQAEGLEAVKEQIKAALTGDNQSDTEHTASLIEESEQSKKVTQVETLLRLARGASYFHTPNQEHFATVNVGEHSEVYPVNGGDFRQWLTRRFYQETEKGPGSQGMQSALDTIKAWAAFDGPEQEVFVRVAAHGDVIYFDLAQPGREVVEITSNGWNIIKESPVPFLRPKGMEPLPFPESPGDLTLLEELINLNDERDRILATAWLIGTLHPSGPYPLLLVQGEQGSGKSMACRMFQKLVDPCKAPLRTVPSEEHDLMIMAENRRVLSFDNLSGMRPELSDSLCRLSTGNGLSTRRLYTDRDEIVFEAARPMLLNGIGEVASRPDLLDRSIKVQLPHIPPEKRIQERVLATKFKQHHATILGGILTAVSAALKNIDHISLSQPPRMADFTAWVIAAEPVLPWQPGAFLQAFKDNLAESVEAALDDDLVAPAIVKFMETRLVWEGRASDLQAELESYAPPHITSSKYWPPTPAAMGKRLSRLMPLLRTTGIQIEKADRLPGSRGWVINKVSKHLSHVSYPSQSLNNQSVSNDSNLSLDDTCVIDVSCHKTLESLSNDTCDRYDGKSGTNLFSHEVEL